MIHQWIVFCFILATCGAQLHLKRLKTDKIMTSSPPTTDENIQQDKPDLRGAPGPIALSALKRGPEITNNSIIDDLKADTKTALLRGYMTLDGGWVAPFNGYQYKASKTGQSWEESRSLCQEEGGDLAQYGVRDVAIRMILWRGLSLKDAYWIGLSKLASEGSWSWLNRNQASPDDGSLWLPGMPVTGSSGDTRRCVFAYFNNNSAGLFFVIDSCEIPYFALCEKPV